MPVNTGTVVALYKFWHAPQVLALSRARSENPHLPPPPPSSQLRSVPQVTDQCLRTTAWPKLYSLEHHKWINYQGRRCLGGQGGAGAQFKEPSK